MHEQKRSGKAQLIASLLGKELLSFAKLEGEINVFRLLSGYYGHKRRKHQVVRIVVKSPASDKAGHFSMFEKERSCCTTLFCSQG